MTNPILGNWLGCPDGCKPHIADHELMQMVESLYDSGDLSAIPKADEPVEPHIICSMGLVEPNDKV